MMTYYKGNTSGGIPGVLPGPPPNPPWGCKSFCFSEDRYFKAMCEKLTDDYYLSRLLVGIRSDVGDPYRLLVLHRRYDLQ